MKRKIIFEDGLVFEGTGFGDMSDRVYEIVFNTSMAGYQEILSDPSYTDQAVVMTYPLIGNYGMAADDYETAVPTIGALLVREYNDEPSNFRSEETLDSVMKRCGIPGVQGIDTRMLTRSIRDHGSRKVLITDVDTTVEAGMKILRGTALPHDAVSRVSCSKVQICTAEKMLERNYGPSQDNDGSLPDSHHSVTDDVQKNGAENAILREKKIEKEETGKRETVKRKQVVAIDCGMKENIVRSFLKRGVTVIRVPWNTSAEEIRSLQPDGIFISNGPGDPTDVPETVETLRNLIGRYPVFGICLGHQIISLAYGAKTYKLKFGHRGGNHPVRDLETGKIEITSQNHSYAVDEESLSGTGLTVTHVNLLDHTVEGMKCERDGVFSVQYHPESAPGPQDSRHLFDRFIRML